MNSDPLIAHLDWDSVEDDIQDELKGSARNRPPSMLFRWWARRPYELVGALLDAAQGLSEEPLTISDPFSGGCTVALEASLRGYRAHAQDLNPWPLTGMDIALSGDSAEAIDEAGACMLSQLRTDCQGYLGHCATHLASELLVAFWVRRLICPRCSCDSYSYPYGLVTLASRTSQESSGFFGCTVCGDVTRHPISARLRRCRTCKSNLPSANSALMSNRNQTCPNCSVKFKAFNYQSCGWKLALVQRKCLREDGTYEVHFDYPSSDDQPPARLYPIPESLRSPIAAGVETNILRRAGFATWADLYPCRQMDALLRAAEYAREIDNPAVRRHLLLAICGAAEMPGYLVRWDRYYPKAFGATDNHRFAPIGLAAELNPLGSQGRGTLGRRLKLARAAIAWNRASTGTRRRSYGPIEFNVGSSTRQPIASETVDLILTDPPYFGDIQYSELSAPLLAWAEAVELVDSPRVNPLEEAIVNRHLHLGPDHYGEMLEGILRESVRTMKPAGSFVMTFNNRDLRAWCALGLALRHSKLWIHAIAPVVSESKNDHSKRARRSFIRDLVVECRLDRPRSLSVRAVTNSREAMELTAAGKMMASHTWSSLTEARALYRSLLHESPEWIDAKADSDQNMRAA